MTDQQTTKQAKSIGTVLVVGGCGFLGAAVVDQLLNFPSEANTPPTPEFPSLASRYPSYNRQTTKVHALDLKCERNRQPGAQYHEADITNIQQLLEVFQKVQPDVVINTVSPQYSAPKEILRKVNIDGTRILLEVAGGKHGDWGSVGEKKKKKNKCQIFVHTSSSSVIHDGMSNLRNANEKYPYICPNPQEYYSETKVHAERLVLAANNKEEFDGMLTCAVRPAGIVGEGDLGGISYGVLYTASIAPAWQLQLQLGDGSNLFDTTYVHNVAYGLLCAVDALYATIKFASGREGGVNSILDNERVDGEAFIVTNDEPGYFWDTTRYLWKLYGRDVDATKIWSLPDLFASVAGALSELASVVTGKKPKLTRQSAKYACIDRYYSCDKLKRRCAYEPKVGLEEGLRRSAKWFLEWEKSQK